MCVAGIETKYWLEISWTLLLAIISYYICHKRFPLKHKSDISLSLCTAWKVSKYGVFSGPYFPAFGLNTEYLSVSSPNKGKYGPEKTPCLDTFHAVLILSLGQFRSGHHKYSIKKVVPKKFLKLTETVCVRVYFLINLQASSLQLLLKRL